MKIIKYLYLVILIATASPASSQSETEGHSVWLWVKNKASEVSSSIVENSETIIDTAKGGAFSASTYIGESYIDAMDEYKIALLWTQEKINKIPEITDCNIRGSNFVGAVIFHGTVIVVTNGFSITTTVAALTGATIYATYKGICYFQVNSKDQLLGDEIVDQTTASNNNLGIFSKVLIS
jgi:hypothetical protein